MSAILVVLGSVTAAQYGRTRLDLFRQGHRVRIVRMDSDSIEPYYPDYLEEDKGDEAEEYLYSDCAVTAATYDDDAMEQFLNRISFAPEDVVAVVALEYEWCIIPEEEHAFGFFGDEHWPRLQGRVMLIDESGRKANPE